MKPGDGFVALVQIRVSYHGDSWWEPGTQFEVRTVEPKLVEMVADDGAVCFFPNPCAGEEGSLLRPETTEERTLRLLRKAAV